MDYEGFALNQYFDQAADYLDQHLSITNVLVHCMAGVSRSVSLVIAYLMKYRGMRFEDALNLIRSRRPVVLIIANSGESQSRVRAPAQEVPPCS